MPPPTELAVVVPSRGRPGNIAELVTAFKETAEFATLLVVVDADDPELDGYLRIRDTPGLEYTSNRMDAVPRSWSLSVQAPARLGETLNRMVPGIARYYPAVGFMGDDHRPRTVGWDRMLCEELGKRPATVAYGNDLVRGRDLATACFWSSDIPRALRRITFPGAIHMYLDDYWMALGERLTLVYRDDVIIEHCHPIAQKGVQWDDTYRATNNGEVYEHDRVLFEQYVADGKIEAEAELIRIAFTNPKR